MGDFAAMIQTYYDYEDKIDECNKTLLESLSEFAINAEPVQLTRLTSCYAWDIMGVTTVIQTQCILVLTWS